MDTGGVWAEWCEKMAEGTTGHTNRRKTGRNIDEGGGPQGFEVIARIRSFCIVRVKVFAGGMATGPIKNDGPPHPPTHHHHTPNLFHGQHRSFPHVPMSPLGGDIYDSAFLGGGIRPPPPSLSSLLTPLMAKLLGRRRWTVVGANSRRPFP